MPKASETHGLGFQKGFNELKNCWEWVFSWWLWRKCSQSSKIQSTPTHKLASKNYRNHHIVSQV